MQGRLVQVCAIVAIAWLSAISHAGIYIDDFSTGVNAAALTGDAAYDSGEQDVHLTENDANQMGSLILPDVDPGQAVRSFKASFDVAIGPGSTLPGNGISFVFGPITNTSTFGEEGPGRGLVFEVSTYDSGAGTVPSIDVIVNGSEIGFAANNPFIDAGFVHVVAELNANGTADVLVNGNPIYLGLTTGYVPAVGDRFGFGGRTSSSTELNRIDNLNIVTTPVPEPSALGLVAVATVCATPVLRRRRG